MRSKLTSMTEAAGLIQDGMLLALGGNALHRTPAAFSRELAGRRIGGLGVCGAAHGYATDLLCAAGAVDTLYFGFVGFENEYGLAPGMRQRCQDGRLRAMEGSCAAVIGALRAGAYGVPFMPIPGMWGSDLVSLRPELFQIIDDPFTDTKVVCVKALVPDYAVVHVQEADEYGNARILGSSYQDVLMTRAAKRTIITTDRIVGTYRLQEEPKLTVIPHFLTEAVVLAPGGARPGICYPEYPEVDSQGMTAYLDAVKNGTVEDYLKVTSEGMI